jgi:hypothetical protein
MGRYSKACGIAKQKYYEDNIANKNVIATTTVATKSAKQAAVAFKIEQALANKIANIYGKQATYKICKQIIEQEERFVV